MDFPTNPVAATRRGKSQESHGIATVELPNGMRLDGYVLLTAKNAARLGISPDKLASLVEGKKKGSVQVTLHLQFGDKDQTVAESVEIDFELDGSVSRSGPGAADALPPRPSR